MRTLLPLLLATAALGGCATDADDDPVLPVPAEGPLYLVHSAMQTTDDRVNYFSLVSSLEGGKIDYGNSIELVGRPRLYAQEGLGFFAIANAEDLSITRYEIGEEGLVEGGSISLRSTGVRSLGAQAVLFVSPTKAYYKDPAEAQIIVWNPTDMVVEDTIALPEEFVREGWITSFGDWVARDGEAFFAASWTSQAYDRVAAGTSLVRIDTETNEVTITEDERCRGLETAGNVDGTLYFFSGVINGFGHHVYPSEGGQQDCILRVSPGSEGFDADWTGTLSSALPEGTAATAAALTADGEIWAQVVDLDTTPDAPGSTYSEWYAGDWRWWHLPVASLDGAVQVPGEPGAYSSFTVSAESGFYISQTAADYSKTTLMDLSGAEPKLAASLDGFVLDIVRVR
jgi:hypothetical protein